MCVVNVSLPIVRVCKKLIPCYKVKRKGIMGFWVQLILADKTQLPEQERELKANCTFIKNRLWIFEGDIDYLDANVTVLSDGAVGSLGGLSEKQLVGICKDTFVFDHSLLIEQ